jgi:hypothetical protein
MEPKETRPKALEKTSKSKLDIEMEQASKEAKTTPGISFYRHKTGDYIFIARTRHN